MSNNFNLQCPYCNNYFHKSFRICKQYDNCRNVICDKCGGKFKAILNISIETTSYEDELVRVLPQDVIQIVRDICTKYINYTGKGGYENTRTITINDVVREIIDTTNNCYTIMLGGRAKFYESEYRTIFFNIFPDGHIDYYVSSIHIWKQKYWWHGETIEERIENYIQHTLIKWETI